MQEQKSFDYRDYTVMIILIAINIIIYMLEFPQNVSPK